MTRPFMLSRLARLTLISLAAATIAGATLASSASAVIIRSANGQAYSYQPLRGAANTLDAHFSDLDYNGGPVLPSNTNYLIFWTPSGLKAYPSEYPTGLAQYLTDLAHDSGGHQNVDSVAAQYGDTTGQRANYQSTFGGSFTDTDSYPSSKCPVKAPTTHCLDDAQLQAELSKFINAKNLPRGLFAGEYFLMLPPNVETCFNSNSSPFQAGGVYGGCSAGEAANPVYCAYHSNTTSAPIIIYANDPYVTGNPGCDDGNHPNGPSDGALEGGLSHEHSESITDPLPNAAWTDLGGSGGEIGDKCGGVTGAALGTHNGAWYNQVINGHYYWYQEEWSNQTHQCLQRLTLSGSLPIARFSVKAGAGDKMNFDASGSSGSPSIAYYNWQFNDPVFSAPFENTAPTTSYTFSGSTSPFTVGLTVFTPNGTSSGAAGLVIPGHNGFVTPFSYAPANPSTATSVSFTSLVPAIDGQPVVVWSWTFGDGTTATGSAVPHQFTKAGTYDVRLVMISAGGTSILMRKITVTSAGLRPRCPRGRTAASERSEPWASEAQAPPGRLSEGMR